MSLTNQILYLGSKTSNTEFEISKKLCDKYIELGGLVSVEGCIWIIANEFGVKLPTFKKETSVNKGVFKFNKILLTIEGIN
jgi:hypothetical protein